MTKPIEKKAAAATNTATQLIPAICIESFSLEIARSNHCVPSIVMITLGRLPPPSASTTSVARYSA
jgi:hypothetical protein